MWLTKMQWLSLLNVDVTKEISISSKIVAEAALIAQDMALKEVPAAMDLIRGALSKKAKRPAKTPP